MLTRSQIIEAVWDFAYDGTSNVVDQYVNYLRRKVDIRSGAMTSRRSGGWATGSGRKSQGRKCPSGSGSPSCSQWRRRSCSRSGSWLFAATSRRPCWARSTRS